MPRVLAPSVSSTTISGRERARRPGPRRGGRAGARTGIRRRHVRVDLGDRVDGLEDGRADRRAPAGGERRRGCAAGPRARWSGATASCANPENTTSPMRGVVVLVLHELAHRGLRRAVSRFGSTSVAHMEPDTSSARITVESRDGHVHADLRAGRRQRRAARARPRTSANGRCRRHAGLPGRRRPDQRDAGVPHRLACAAAGLPDVGGDQQRQHQQASRRANGHSNAHRYTARPNRRTDSPTPASSSSRGRGRERGR